MLPIPEPNQDGDLPPGIHDATLDEIEERFGRFRSTDHRVHLYQTLTAYIQDLSALPYIEAVILDGSFVSSKLSPGDIDLLVVLKPDFITATQVIPSEYNLLTKSKARSIYGPLDIFTAVTGSTQYITWTRFFGQDTRRPGISKGLLRLIL